MIESHAHSSVRTCFYRLSRFFSCLLRDGLFLCPYCSSISSKSAKSSSVHPIMLFVLFPYPVFSKDWLFKGPKESDPLLIPISNGIPLENWNFPNSPFGIGGRGPNAGCCFVFSFRLPCSEICYIRETKQIPRLFHPLFTAF